MDGRRFIGLTNDEARAAMSIIPVGERLHWLAWREGWPEWRPITALRDLLNPISRVMQVTPPRLPREDNYKEETVSNIYQFTSEFNKPKTQTNTQKGKGSSDTRTNDIIIERPGNKATEFFPRKYRRHRKKFRVQIFCQGRAFKTYSKDISVGGMLLEDPLPDWVVGYCKARIIKRKTREAVELTCSIVEGQPPNKRFRVEFTSFEDQDAVEGFDEWLAA